MLFQFSVVLPIHVVSLATLTLSFESHRPNAATYKLNKEDVCTSPPHGWLDIRLPDTCVPLVNTGYQTLQVITSWPICDNGTEAKFGVFSTDNCEGGLHPLMDRKEVLDTCFHLKPSVASFSFWCEGPTPIKVPTREERKGGIRRYPNKSCSRYDKPEAEMYAADTCIDVVQGQGLEFIQGATCKNGTKAMAAGFKGIGCDPTLQPLKHPFTEWDERVIGLCVPTDDIKSMAFWCEGFDGIDMTKPRPKIGRKSNLGLILGLGLGLGGPIVLVGGIVVGYYTNWHFRTWVQERFGGGEGYIAL